MGESLRDQLIKAGLARDEQSKRAKRPPRRPKGKVKPATGNADQVNLAAAYKARERQELRERKEAERAEREAAERRRQTRAAIRQLLAEGRLNDSEATIPYHFSIAGKVKHVYVTEDQQRLLAAGQLAIVLLDGQRHLVPVETGRHINDLDPTRVVVVHDPVDTGVSGP